MGFSWPAGGHHFIELQPDGQQLLAGVANQPPLEAGLGADQKGRALWRKRKFFALLAQKIKADKKVEDRAQPAFRRAGCCLNLIQRLGAAI